MKKILSLLIAAVFSLTVAAFASAEIGIPILAVAVPLFIIGISTPMPAGVALMAITYSTTCDEVDLTHYCDDCPDPELARVRGVAFIKDDYTFADPTSYAEWVAAINSGDVIIIPMTRGSFDGGSPVEGTGYGDQATKYMSTAYGLTYFDPNYAANRDFYNNIKRFQNYRVAFKTETKVHLTDKVCQVLPKNPIEDNVDAEVVWEVNVKWSSQNETSIYTCPAGIFVCFQVS